ncbi:hypothetical protein GYB61_04755 [bacterium]|nr:hypothetical protein [bacterium]
MHLKTFRSFSVTALVISSTTISAAANQSSVEDALEAFRLWSLGIGSSTRQTDLMTSALPQSGGSSPEAQCALATITEFGYLSDHPDREVIDSARRAARSDVACPLFLTKVVENARDGYDEGRQWAFDALYGMALNGNVQAAESAARFIVQNERLAPYWQRGESMDAPDRLYEAIQRAPDSSPYKWRALHGFCRAARWNMHQADTGPVWIRDVLEAHTTPNELDLHCARMKALKLATASDKDLRPAPDTTDNRIHYPSVHEALFDRRERLRPDLNAVWPDSTVLRVGAHPNSERALSLVSGEFVRVVSDSATSVGGETWVEVMTAEVDNTSRSDGVAGWVPQTALVLGGQYQASTERARVLLREGNTSLAIATLAVMASKGNAQAFYELGMAPNRLASDRSQRVAGRTDLSDLHLFDQDFFQRAANSGYGPAQMELAAILRDRNLGNAADVAYWFGRAWVGGQQSAQAPALENARRLPAVSVNVASANLRSRPTTDSDIVGSVSRNAVGHRLTTRGDWTFALWPSTKALAWVYTPLTTVAHAGGTFPPAPPPVPGRTVCSTRCNNGDCYRTYSDGRQVRVRARQVFDAASSQWRWDAGPC